MIRLILALLVIWAFHIWLAVVYAVEQAQAIFTPSGGGGIPPWQFGLILITPGILAVSLTIIWTRYQRYFAMDEGIERSKRQWFMYTLKTGAVFGVLSQAGLQGVVMFLTSMPIMWELLGVAVFITGLVSAGLYEAARYWLSSKIKKGNLDWVPVYEWLSLKRLSGESVLSEGDDGTIISRYLRDDGAPADYADEDKTVRNND